MPSFFIKKEGGGSVKRTLMWLSIGLYAVSTPIVIIGNFYLYLIGKESLLLSLGIMAASLVGFAALTRVIVGRNNRRF
jgi:hypothetical protein